MHFHHFLHINDKGLLHDQLHQPPNRSPRFTVPLTLRTAQPFVHRFADNHDSANVLVKLLVFRLELFHTFDLTYL
jgi:hypothetical protein